MAKYIIAKASTGDHVSGHGGTTAGRKYAVLSQYLPGDAAVKIMSDDGKNGTPGVELWLAQIHWKGGRVYDRNDFTQ